MSSYKDQHNTSPIVDFTIMCSDDMVINKLRVKQVTEHPLILLLTAVACVDDFIKRMNDDQA